MVVAPIFARGIAAFACLLTLTGALVAQQTPAVTPPAPLPATPAAPREPLTVEEAVAFALRNNPTVTRAVQDVAIAQTQVDVAQANRRPNVNLSTTATWVPNPSSVTLPGSSDSFSLNPEFTVSAGVAASQPIWPTERWRAPIRLARAGVGINQEALTRTRQQIAFQTRQAFYQLVNAQELLGVSQDALDVASEQLRLAQNTFAAGLSPRLDVFQAEAAVANARVNLTRSQNAVDIARAGLAVQLGLPAGTPLTITSPRELPTAPAEVDPLVTLAFRNRPELAQLNYRREQLRASIELTRLEQRPILNLQGNYSQNLTDGGLSLGASGLSFSAALAFNAYNGGRTRAELEGLRLQLEQVDTSARQLELGITQDVRTAWLNLRNAIDQLTAAQQQLTAADEALRIAQVRYENGEGIFLEREQARLNRTQALTSLAQARNQAQIAAAQLEFALGTAPTTPLTR